MDYLFTYGTLQDTQVQVYVFGRILKGHNDSLSGFNKQKNAIYGRYPLILRTRDKKHKVQGVAYEVTMEDLQKADIYETTAYQRQKLVLESGREAWVYLENSK